MNETSTNRLTPKNCSICGEPFFAEQEHERYCCNACRQFASQTEPANPAMSTLIQSLGPRGALKRSPMAELMPPRCPKCGRVTQLAWTEPEPVLLPARRDYLRRTGFKSVFACMCGRTQSVLAGVRQTHCGITDATPPQDDDRSMTEQPVKGSSGQ